MKTSNLILKVMENLQTNVALVASIRTHLLIDITDEDYDIIANKIAEKELERPTIGLHNMMKQFEEEYNYLEQLLLTMDKPF